MSWPRKWRTLFYKTLAFWNETLHEKQVHDAELRNTGDAWYLRALCPWSHAEWARALQGDALQPRRWVKTRDTTKCAWQASNWVHSLAPSHVPTQPHWRVSPRSPPAHGSPDNSYHFLAIFYPTLAIFPGSQFWGYLLKSLFLIFLFFSVYILSLQKSDRKPGKKKSQALRARHTQIEVRAPDWLNG